MSWTLRSDQNYIDLFRRNHGFEMNCKSVREEERFALRQIRRDILQIGRGLFGIRQGDKDNIGAFDRFRGRPDDSAGGGDGVRGAGRARPVGTRSAKARIAPPSRHTPVVNSSESGGCEPVRGGRVPGLAYAQPPMGLT